MQLMHVEHVLHAWSQFMMVGICGDFFGHVFQDF